MPRRNSWLLRGLSALVVILPAARSRADERFTTPSANSTLHAGTEVTVRWSGSRVKAEGAREMELLLSTDGGQTFAVRVTAEIEPGALEVSWRVPSLPTAHARLALRVGSGNEESERIVLVSEEFVIQAHPGEPKEGFFRVGEEWHTRDALTIRESELPAPRSLTSDPAISGDSDPERPMTPPPTEPLLEPPPPSREPAPSCPLILRPGSVSGSAVRRVLLPLRE